MPSGNSDNNSGIRRAPEPAVKRRGYYTLSWWLERICGFWAGLLLTASAFGHLSNNYYFLSTIYSYQIVSVTLGYWIAIFLPFFQMIIAVILSLRRDMTITYILAAALFIIFTSAQWSAWIRNLDIPCGCFGTTQMKIGMTSISLAVSGVVVSLVGLVLYNVHRFYVRASS